MAGGISERIRVHDVLEVDSVDLLRAAAVREEIIPEWVPGFLTSTPFVHVRRGLEVKRMIPVGIRGATRSQRWSTLCPRTMVQGVTTPEQALALRVDPERASSILAFQSLNELKRRWMAVEIPWGPIGSISFELCTGYLAATKESDLDVVLFPDRAMTREEACDLLDLTANLPSAIDIRVETGSCGFSLKEYGGARTKDCLLRTDIGDVLRDDPWSSIEEIYDHA